MFVITNRGFLVEPFYGINIDPEKEKEKIQKILSKYVQEPVSDDLKEKIYKELLEAKAKGIILIPFKVVMRKHPTDLHRDFIEVILDTKV